MSRRRASLHMERQIAQINNGVSVGESEKDAGSTNSKAGKQATGKQLVAIVFILTIATKMFLLPIFLINTTGRDAYIALSVICGFELITLGVILLAMKIGEADFFTLMISLFGKVGAKIVVGFFGLFMFFKLNIAVAEALSFYGDNIFTDFSPAIMIFVLLFFLAAAGVHTLRALCRLNELLIPLIVVCMAILVAIVIMTGVDLSNILPTLQNGGEFGDGLLHHLAWLGDFTPLVLFIGRTKMKKHTGLLAAASGVVGTSIAVFFALVMSSAFGNAPMLADMGTNLSTILQFAIGNVYGRIDMFSSMLWSISVFIESALFFYSTARCIAFVIGKNSNLLISLGVCAALYFSQVFVMTDPTLFSEIVRSFACSVIVAAYAVVMPVLAIVGAAVDKRKRASDRMDGDNAQAEASRQTATEAKE